MNLAEQLKALLAEATALAAKSEKGELTTDDESRWEPLKSEIADVRQKLAAETQRRTDAAEWRQEDQRLRQSAGRVSSIVPPAQQNGVDPRVLDQRERERFQRLGARVVGSEGYQRFTERGFAGNTGEIPAETFYRGPFAGDAREIRSPEDQYTLVSTGALPTDMISPQRIPGVFGPDLPEFNVRSAFLNLQTGAEVITYYRALARTNSAAFVAEATTTSGADGTKPEGGATWERATSVVETLAEWFPVTNQLLADESAMRGMIEGVLLDDLARVEDDALLNGNGTAPNIRGLLNVSGIQVADAAYFAGAPVEDPGTPNENFNRALRAKQLVRYTGRKTPTFYIINPIDMEHFLTTTDANRQYLAGGPFSAGLIPSLWRMPVIESESIAAGTFVAGAGRAAIVFDRMAAAVTVGWIDKQFIRNMQTILAEERLTLAVPWPAAFVKGTFAAW